MLSDSNDKANSDPDEKRSVPIQTPQIRDEQSSGGSTPATSSDDNVLDNAHDMGLYEDADEEHPAELNIAAEIEKDEKARREN